MCVLIVLTFAVMFEILSWLQIESDPKSSIKTLLSFYCIYLLVKQNILLWLVSVIG